MLRDCAKSPLFSSEPESEGYLYRTFDSRILPSLIRWSQKNFIDQSLSSECPSKVSWNQDSSRQNLWLRPETLRLSSLFWVCGLQLTALQCPACKAGLLRLSPDLRPVQLFKKYAFPPDGFLFHLNMLPVQLVNSSRSPSFGENVAGIVRSDLSGSSSPFDTSKDLNSQVQWLAQAMMAPFSVLWQDSKFISVQFKEKSSALLVSRMSRRP